MGATSPVVGSVVDVEFVAGVDPFNGADGAGFGESAVELGVAAGEVVDPPGIVALGGVGGVDIGAGAAAVDDIVARESWEEGVAGGVELELVSLVKLGSGEGFPFVFEDGLVAAVGVEGKGTIAGACDE
jgi:hypothetical protein